LKLSVDGKFEVLKGVDGDTFLFFERYERRNHLSFERFYLSKVVAGERSYPLKVVDVDHLLFLSLDQGTRCPR
jgi:hypothetical protein